MLVNMMTSRLLIGPNPAHVILVFFIYSFLGNVMECVFLTVTEKKITTNRGFVSHLPFCIIYGFGALAGYGLLCSLKDNWAALFVVGAIAATGFEYVVAQLQICLFGDFWWDYTHKPFNYKGILCLESTIGWGFVAVIVICLLHRVIVGVVHMIPAELTTPIATFLIVAYTLDFVLSARIALINRQNGLEAEQVTNDDKFVM